MSFATSRLALVKPSASAWISQAAKEAKAQGEDVIDLGLGEPDFDTPDHIKDAAHQAALRGETKYPPTNGTLEMRQTILNKLKRENNLDYALDEVIVSNGATQVLFNTLMATLEPGDEVLLSTPYFGRYKDIVLRLGGVPVPLAGAGFSLKPDQLSKAIKPKTRWLLLNQPSNPSGSVYSDAEIASLGAMLADHDRVRVLSDEIYEQILFDRRISHSFAALFPHLKDRTLTVKGVLEAYAMAGGRIGYGVGAKAFIAAMNKVQSQIRSGACSIAQAAALNGSQNDVCRFRAAFERLRNLVVARVADIPGLTLDPTGGAFYGLIGCDALIDSPSPDGTPLSSDADVIAYLLKAAGVAAVPGSTLDLPHFFRISTAMPEEVLNKALDGIAKAVADLKGLSP
ncbi:pyridoxal phosphate-dependent aminotransferase [Ruegeria litorea]|uniref:aspartate transaminase n=1 Tax=Falsiruegeria litorea TaxID=1280831 RepID=A0ABS5WT50_9RHOB|nr:pyridoxal phosphate-dependent aminotransferase [Falsiruegeria litorea]MBT3142308.1 pyridoxal phosphate-dependent aminotransferase [Falsiruegeria litorea]